MNTGYRNLLILAVSSGLVATQAFAQLGTSPPASSARQSAGTMSSKSIGGKDRSFVNTAAEAGAAEVAMGKLAADNASAVGVKDFGARMVADHQKARDELKAISGAKGLTPSDRLSKKDQSELDKLNKLKGAKFDREYVKTQLSAHKEAVALFASESKNGSDTDLKRFASTTLPTLQDHLRMVQQLSKAGKS